SVGDSKGLNRCRGGAFQSVGLRHQVIDEVALSVCGEWMLRSSVTSASNFQEAEVPWDMGLSSFNAVQHVFASQAVIETYAHPHESEHPRFIAVVDRKRFLQSTIDQRCGGARFGPFDHI